MATGKMPSQQQLAQMAGGGGAQRPKIRRR
jgi:hypothetical protein